MKCRDNWMTIVIVIVFILFPFCLNWILQKEAFVPVIGDSSTWLAFWGTYIGAVLTAVMVLATFITIRKTSNLNRSQWKIEWLKSFRAAAVDMISAVDSTAVGQMAQDVNFGRFDQAVEKGHTMEIAVKRSTFMLSSLLREYDDLFNAHKGEEYIDELNSFISPFFQETGEIIQFAIICKFLKEKADMGNRMDGVKVVYRMSDSMAANQYHAIEEALRCLNDGENTDDVIHNAVVKMQQNLASVDTKGLEKLLLRISSQNTKLTYGSPFMAASKKGKRA